jgi:outer membrane protein
MRIYILLAGLSLLGFATTEATAQAPPGVAFVRSRRLLEEAPGAKEASTTLQREQNKLRTDLALSEDSLTKMLNEYQQKMTMLSATAKKAQEDAIKAKRVSLENRAGQADQQMRKRQQELLQPVMERINKALEEIRKENRYSIILDADNGIIVAADSTLDLTSKVLAKLRGPAPATPRKPN